LANEIALFFQGLLFLMFFHVIGHPIVNAFLRRSSVPTKLKNLDSIQKLPLEFVIGCAVVYIVALIMTPFHFFNAVVLWVIIGISAFAYLYQHLKGLASFDEPSKYSLVALAAFAFALAIRVIPISNFILGSNQDTSWHTLLTYSIIRDGGIPSSVIEGFILQVPVGVHTVLAAFSLVSGIPPEFVVFYGTVFFSAVIGLAAYLFGSVIISKKFGVYVSLIMISFSLYPSAITWGSDWLLLGLIVFFVSATLMVLFTTESFPLNRSGLLTALLPGLIIGFLASTYIPLYVILIPTSVLMIVMGRKEIFSLLKRFATILLLGVPLMAIWIYRFFFLSQPTTPYISLHSLWVMDYAARDATTRFLPFIFTHPDGTVETLLSSPSLLLNTIKNWLTWDYQNGWPGALVFFLLLSIGCILSVRYLLDHKIKAVEPLGPRYIVSIFAVTILWGLNGPLGLFYSTRFGLSIMITELDKIAPLIGTIFLPFIATYGLLSVDSYLRKKTNTKRLVSVCIIVLVTVTTLATVPLTDRWLFGNYAVFASATESDYELLKWINSEIPQDARILVHPYDAGQYVPSIANRKTIGIASSGLVFLSQQIEDINWHIRHIVINPITVRLLRELNVDYIFVGGQPFKERWDEHYFLGNPLYFSLVRNLSSIGNPINSLTTIILNSSLFAVKTPDNSIGTGFINNDYYYGFSNNETLLDLQHMAMYNLGTGEGVYLEIGLMDRTGNSLDLINSWNQPKAIGVLEQANQTEGRLNFTLNSSQHSYSFSLSTDNGEINLRISVPQAPQSSFLTLSFYFLADNFWGSQSGVSFNSSSIRYLSSQFPVQAHYDYGAASFEMFPHLGQIVATYGPYLSVRSYAFLNVTIRTRQIG
jgi:hypothetical protein